MLICPNCGHSNQEGFNFCEKCGTNLSARNENTQINNTKTEATQNMADTTTTNQPEPPKKKSNVKKYVFALAGVFILYILLSNIILAFSPAIRLMKGMADFGSGSKFTSEAVMSFNYKGSDDVLSLLDNVSLKGKVYGDIEKLLAETNFTIMYNEKDLTEIKAGVNDEVVWIDPMKLYEEKFFLELPSEATEVMEDVKIYMDAAKKIKPSFNNKEYLKIVKDVLGKDIKNSLGKVTVTLDYETAMELLSEMLDYAQDDEKLMKSVRKNGISFIKNVMKQEKKFNVLYDDDAFEEALEMFEDEDDFEDLYDMLITSLQSGLEGNIYVNEDVIPEIEVTFHYGLFNNLKKVTYNTTMEIENYDGKFEIDYLVTTTKGARFTNFNSKKATDLEDLIDDPDEARDIVTEITENLIDTTIKNKDFEDDIEEIEDTLDIEFDDLADLIEDSF